MSLILMWAALAGYYLWIYSEGNPSIVEYFGRLGWLLASGMACLLATAVLFSYFSPV